MKQGIANFFDAAWPVAVALALASCTGGARDTDTSASVAAHEFTVGGAVSGLDGTGLVLQDNVGDDLAVASSGAFTFPTRYITGSSYAVSVLTQPNKPNQSCVVGGASGAVGGANVTNIAVTCTDKTTATDTIGGTASGVLGSGLVLQNNGGDNLAVASDGEFTFAAPLAAGVSYEVSIFSPPINPYQDCVIMNGAGVTAASNITNVAVSCKSNVNPTYTIGGTVTGVSGAAPVTLLDNGRDNLTVTTDGPFTFSLPIPSGSAYNVTSLAVGGQQSKTCTFSNASGIVAGGNITNVSIACKANALIKLNVAGLSGSALPGSAVVLQNNGGDTLTVARNGAAAFATALASGAAYDVTVITQPSNPVEVCSVANGVGTVTPGSATVISVTCVNQGYTISGTVSGLSGTGLVLQDNGGNNLAVTKSGAFVFTKPIASGSKFLVSVLTQPSNVSQTCRVSGGAGTIGDANITGVRVQCTTNTYTIGGAVSGLAGTPLVLLDNGGNAFTVAANGAFNFSIPLASGATYAVTVQTQPANPYQTCLVVAGDGTVGGGNVTSVQVRCTANTYTVGGTISGLNGTGLVLQDNGGNNLAVTKSGAFVFTKPIASGSKFLVSVLTQPSNVSQTCRVSGGAGTIGDADIAGVQVQCTTNTYTVGGTVSGLAGAPLVLLNNGGNAFTVAANGAFNFSIPLASGATYAVTVQTQPANPYQTCLVVAGGGTVGGGDVTNVQVQCTTNTYTVGGTVSGLKGSGLVLLDNGGNPRTITANGAFTFTTPVASGDRYTVTIGVQPSAPTQTCTVTANGSGPITNANVTGVAVACVTNNYTLSINVSVVAPGTLGSGLAVTDNFGATLPVPGTALQPGAYQLDTLPSGSNYIVTITQQPGGTGGNFCAVANGTGTVTDAAVTNIDIECITPYNYLYVTNRTGNDISGFAIDNFTSTLVPVTGVIAPAGKPNAIAATLPTGDIEPTAAVTGCTLSYSQALGYYPISLYIANSGATTISNYQVDTLTGALTFIGDSVSASGSPVFLDYYNNEGEGCLLFGLNIVPPGATGYTTNGATGALTAAAGSPYAAPDSSASNAASLATYQNSETATTAQFVLGIDSVLHEFELWVYPVDTTTGILGPVSNEFQMPSGSDAIGTDTLLTPGSLTYPFVYVASQTANTISVYEYQATNDLVPVQLGVATGPGPTAMAFVSNTNELQPGNASPLLYVANGGDGTISAYSVETGASATTGMLTPVAIPAVAHGTTPAAMASEWAGDMGPFLYVVNSNSNDIYVYKVNLTAPSPTQPLPIGALTFVGNYPVGTAPSAIGIVSFVDQ